MRTTLKKTVRSEIIDSRNFEFVYYLPEIFQIMSKKHQD